MVQRSVADGTKRVGTSGRVSVPVRRRPGGAAPKVKTSLRERVKELSCLYCVAQLMVRTDVSPGRLLQLIAECVPSAWQYPRLAACRIELDGQVYGLSGIDKRWPRLSAAIRVRGAVHGRIDVVYSGKVPGARRDPFLKEERSLLDALARQLVAVVRRREAEQEQQRLHKQLLHADRLATIGQLAAGVAHELNEPLGSVLGFAQLALKEKSLSGQARDDIGRIVTASLHAREIIRQLLLFARQSPALRGSTDLSKIAADAISLFDHRCSRDGVTVVRRLATALPPLHADAGQLTQVLVNLLVNAIQAMPAGGTLEVRTGAVNNGIELTVSDSGIGMDAATVERIFVPFFTTKDIHEGTGLGLPVVYGILQDHGASISVDSVPGRGTCFTVLFPSTAATAVPARGSDANNT